MGQEGLGLRKGGGGVRNEETEGQDRRRGKRWKEDGAGEGRRVGDTGGQRGRSWGILGVR